MMKNIRGVRNQGFTLVECLISFLLIVLVLSGGMDIFFYVDSFMARASHKKLALEIAESKMEQLRKYGYSALPEPAGSPVTTSVPIGGLSAQESVTVTDVDEYPPDGKSDYKQVIVMVNWLEPLSSVAKNVSLTTYIAP